MKILVTPKRVSIIIVSLYIVLFFSAAPSYTVNRIGMKFSPARNKTLLGLIFTDNQVEVEKISYAINNTFVPFTAFVIISVCTVTLVIKLKSKTEWRKKSTTSQADVSNRNQKVAKMIVIISTLFIISFIPVSVNFMAMSLVPGLSIGGRYINTLSLTIGIGLILESVNSSVNILVYYKMSSNYRTVFQNIFHMNRSWK